MTRERSFIKTPDEFPWGLFPQVPHVMATFTAVGIWPCAINPAPTLKTAGGEIFGRACSDNSNFQQGCRSQRPLVRQDAKIQIASSQLEQNRGEVQFRFLSGTHSTHSGLHSFSKSESIGEKRLETSAPLVGKVCCRRLLGLSLASISCERADVSHHAFEAMGGCAEHRFDFRRRCW